MFLLILLSRLGINECVDIKLYFKLHSGIIILPLAHVLTSHRKGL